MNATVEVIYIVNAYERQDGVYVFRNESDAEEFAAVLDAGDVPNRLTRETVCHRPETVVLIEAEAQVRYSPAMGNNAGSRSAD